MVVVVCKRPSLVWSPSPGRSTDRSRMLVVVVLRLLVLF